MKPEGLAKPDHTGPLSSIALPFILQAGTLLRVEGDIINNKTGKTGTNPECLGKPLCRATLLLSQTKESDPVLRTGGTPYWFPYQWR